MSRELVGWKPYSANLDIASTRLRCFNPLNELRVLGYPVELYEPDHRYSVVVYSKLYDAQNYEEAVLLKIKGSHIIFDLCDNHFYNPNDISEWKIKAVNLRKMLNLADTIVTPTDTLAKIIINELTEPKQVRVIGEAIEAVNSNLQISDSFSAKIKQNKTRGIVPIIWYGNASCPNYEGGISELHKLKPVLEDVNKDHQISLTVISNSYSEYEKYIKKWRIATFYLNWELETCQQYLRLHDIAVIPFRVNPVTIAKSNNRLLLNLYNGVATVADSIPSYLPFSKFCILDNWKEGLIKYITNQQLRKAHVNGARKVIESSWLIKHIAGQWQRLFDSCLAKSSLHLLS